jgi:hypothetical protein
MPDVRRKITVNPEDRRHIVPLQKDMVEIVVVEKGKISGIEVIRVANFNAVGILLRALDNKLAELV